MTRIRQSLMAVGLVLAFNSIWAQPELMQKNVFSLGNVQIDSTTLDEIQEKYGKATTDAAGKEDEAEVRVCYVHNAAKVKTFVVFETGPMGGFKRVTGFRITKLSPMRKCFATEVDLAALTSGNGVHLGQRRENFMQLFPVAFKNTERGVAYEGESKREATKEELERLKTIWPNEKQAFFDVATTIKADFNKGRLVDYYVSKIESY